MGWGLHIRNIKREWAFVKKQNKKKKNKHFFSTFYINRLMKIVHAEKYAETTIRSACQKTFTNHKTGKRFVFLVSSYYVFHNGHEHHHIKSFLSSQTA